MMQINELRPSQAKEISRDDYKEPGDISKKLSLLGFERIGEGSYSEIYRAPNSNAVVKVTQHEDKCWLNFAKLAQKHYKRFENFPKISKMKQYQSEDGETFLFAFMESLQLINANSEIYQTVKEIEDKLSNDYTFVDLEDIIIGKEDGVTIFSEFDEEYKSLIRTLALIEFKRDPGCEPDLHFGNIMLRNGKTPVIIDPWA